MRKLSPAFIVTALALASGSAFAQTSSSDTTTPPATTTPSTTATPDTSNDTNPAAPVSVNPVLTPVVTPVTVVALAPPPAPAPTPLFELTARQGAAKEASRRARGEEPRVYGIAPRTDRDLTRQMPDDPVIRY